MEIYLITGILLLVGIIILTQLIRIRDRKLYRKAQKEYTINLELIRKESFMKGVQKANLDRIKEVEELKEKHKREIELIRGSSDFNNDGIVDEKDLSKVISDYNKDKPKRTRRKKNETSN